MLLVDPSVIDTLQLNQPPALTSHNITKRVIQEADASIDSALSDKMLTPSEKLLYYNQALQKREHYADKNIPQKLPKTEDDQVGEEIIDSVPPSYRNKASLLVKKLKRDEVLGWNEGGNLMYNGEVVPGTNIVDIVNDVLRPRSKNPQPKGWDLVAQGIKETNVPLELVGNHKRYATQQPVRKIDEFHTTPLTPQQLNFQTPAKKLTPQQKHKQRIAQRKMPAMNNPWIIK